MTALEWIVRPKLREPVALLAFTGWGDAGDASSDAARHLVAAHEAETIGRLDCDSFIDFQVNRPMVSIDPEGVRSITWPKTEILAVHMQERDVVVVVGNEPNFNWGQFASEVSEVLVELGIDQAITLGAFADQVAHTLPVPVVGSSSSPRMIVAHGLLPSRYEGPTGISGVLTQALSDQGIDCVSLWAAVPHYLSSQAYPPGVEALLRKVSEIADLTIDTARLQRHSASFRRRVEMALDESEELAEYVRQLERDLASEDSGEDLVDEIERYLRDV